MDVINPLEQHVHRDRLSFHPVVFESGPHSQFANSLEGGLVDKVLEDKTIIPRLDLRRATFFTSGGETLVA